MPKAARVCDACYEAALEYGADEAEAVEVMRECGLDIGDHLCSLVDTGIVEGEQGPEV